MNFPGPEAAYRNALVNITSAEVIAEAALWAAQQGADGAYNITNGDIFRWAHVWPRLADFGIEAESRNRDLTGTARASPQFCMAPVAQNKAPLNLT